MVEANLELGFKEDLRDYGIGAQILRDLGVGTVKLLTNNPHKLDSLAAYGSEVVRIPLEVEPHIGNIDYLANEKGKAGASAVGSQAAELRAVCPFSPRISFGIQHGDSEEQAEEIALKALSTRWTSSATARWIT